MSMFKGVLLILSLMTLLSVTGCSYKETNEMIAQANTTKFVAFGTAMNGATSEGARIAIAMAYASGMGDQAFFKPQSALEYMKASIPLVRLGMEFLGSSGSEENEGYSQLAAGRDIFIGSGKRDTTTTSLELSIGEPFGTFEPEDAPDEL